MGIGYRIKQEIREINFTYVICSASIMLLTGIFCLVVSDGYYMYNLIYLPRAALPFLLFVLLSIIHFALTGACFGAVLSRRANCNRNSWEKTGLLILLVIMELLMWFWFLLFFRSLSIFFSLVILIIAGAICFFTVRLFLRVYYICALAALVHLLWFLYLFWFNISVLLLN